MIVRRKPANPGRFNGIGEKTSVANQGIHVVTEATWADGSVSKKEINWSNNTAVRNLWGFINTVIAQGGSVQLKRAPVNVAENVK